MDAMHSGFGSAAAWRALEARRGFVQCYGHHAGPAAHRLTSVSSVDGLSGALRPAAGGFSLSVSETGIPVGRAAAVVFGKQQPA